MQYQALASFGASFVCASARSATSCSSASLVFSLLSR